MLTDFDYLVSFPGLGIKDLEISRIAFKIFSVPVYWYGLLIATSILVCLFLAIRQSRYYRLTPDDILDTFIAIIPGMIIFARLYYVVFEWQFYKDDWKLIFDTRAGGLAFYGGVIGGVLAALIVTRIKKIPFSRMADFLAVYIPLGQAIGRWGNFFNQEAFGSNTTLPWGMISNETTRYLGLIGQAGIDPALPVHPTFLYEFIANMVLFFILYQVRRRTRQPYAVILSYLLGYGIVRFFVESIRTDALYIPGTELRVSMLLSAAMVLFSIIGLIVGKKYYQKKMQMDDLGDRSELGFDMRGGREYDPDKHGDASFIELEDLSADQITAEEAATATEIKLETDDESAEEETL